MKVIDASGLAALAFAETDAPFVIDAIDDQELAAPFLLPFELASLARKKMRLRPDAIDVLGEQLRDGLEMPVALMDVDHIEVVALATALGLTAYDASYLWLAKALGAELVTLDKALAKAHDLGVDHFASGNANAYTVLPAAIATNWRPSTA